MGMCYEHDFLDEYDDPGPRKKDKRPSFIYVLHFDKPLYHARHYMGATTDLAARLNRHQSGHSARIITALRDAGVGWTLGGLYICTTYSTNIFKTEKLLKQRHHGPNFCRICMGDTPLMPIAHTASYPIDELPDSIPRSG